MGRCSCTHCHAPCTRARNSLPPPVESPPFSHLPLLSCARSPLSALFYVVSPFCFGVFFFIPPPASLERFLSLPPALKLLGFSGLP